MFTLKRLIRTSLFVFLLASTALAQENRAPIDTPREPVASGPLVTATATAKRVRFVSPGSVVQLRLEVYNEAGQKLFDTELRGGNVLDWPLQDGAGQRLPSGSYACVLTSKSLSGRFSQRVGLVTVNEMKAAIQATGTGELSMAQQQTIGPVEGNAAFTVLRESEAEAITAVTHNGSDGQVTSTRGALAFSTGDVFAGKEKERMRLTAEGRLGIGTSDPQANLDVAGTIRAGEGLMFSDGSTLRVNEKGVLTRTSADGGPKAITVTTQHKIAKFTDNLGTVGDSVITESVSGNIGIGNASPQSLLQVGTNPGYGTTTGLLVTNNLIGTQYDRAFQLAPRQTANPASNSVLMYALPTVNTGVTVPSQYGFFVDGKQGTGVISSYAAIATGQAASLGATNNTHLLLGNLPIPAGNYAIYDNTGYKSFFNGNVGIGTSNPLVKLDVAGHINTSTQYNIGGSRVLITSSFSGNIFAGNSAGAMNGLGSGNSFFGQGSGQSNVNGANNSFFGRNAGVNNTASGNSFFGEQSGFGNSTGTTNSYFGKDSGRSNGAGSDNAFFGFRAGFNATGSGNSFFGSQAGDSVTSGFRNAFFGYKAGATANTAIDNSFFGYNAGTLTTSSANAFFGASAGAATTSGLSNSFFGANAGAANTLGSTNAFFGSNAGAANTTGSSNSFFGSSAGVANTVGQDNAFFGRRAGADNTGGDSNSFFGTVAGADNTIGDSNSFFGAFAGADNTIGSGNSFFGREAGFMNTLGAHNTYFGRSAGRFNTLASDNTFVGYVAGDNSTGNDNTFIGADAGGSNTTGYSNTFVGRNAGDGNTIGNNNTVIGNNADVTNGPFGDGLSFATAIGAGALAIYSHTVVIGRSNDNVIVPGILSLGTFQIEGNDQLCSAGSFTGHIVGNCSSSLRYKTNLAPFRSGLSFINQLRPITYNWKRNGLRAVGFGAEDVEKIDPRFVTYNEAGKVEGVRYDHLSTVFVNAFKEQQTQIGRQQRQIDQLQQIVCRLKPRATACKIPGSSPTVREGSKRPRRG